MFGIYTRLKPKFDYIKRVLFSKGEYSFFKIGDQALYPRILANADNVFSDFAKLGSPNPSFTKLLRLKKRNSSSVDRDSASVLYFLAKRVKAKTAIEVGIYRGAGSVHLAQALSENGGGELHLIDISNEFLKDVNRKIMDFKFKIKISLHFGSSSDKKILKQLPLADIIFIDADHTYEAVKKDFDNFWKLLKIGGVIALHDTVMWPGTRKLANELFEKGYPIVTLATSGGAGISYIKKG